MDAREAIGPEQQTDYRLEPQKHASRLPAEAGALARILEDSAVRAVIGRYEDAGRDAKLHQAHHLNAGKYNIVMAAGAAIAGALVLHMGSGDEASGPHAASRMGLIGLQWICLAGVAATEFLRRTRNSYEKWMSARSRAESSRVELFELVCGLRDVDLPIEQRPGELPLLPLQLEYFLRYQLGVQVLYFRNRGREHAAAARRLAGIGGALTFLAALGAAAAGIGVSGVLGVAVVVGIVAPVLLNAQSNLSRLNQDERNAARYAITREKLRDCEAQADSIRRAAERGDHAPVEAFIRRAQDVISLEHKEWIADQAKAAEVAQLVAEAE
jgi:hypothetical protein